MKKPKQQAARVKLTLLLIRKRGKILLTPSPRVQGFWDLPEALPGLSPGAALGTFRHTIMNRHYLCEVREAIADRIPEVARWRDEMRLQEIPLSTTAKKAIRVSFRHAAQQRD